MADTLSKNFCSLCGLPFDRFGTQNDAIKTSLASKIVEESGLLDMLNISVAPLRKELVFICISCRTVFSNYTVAKKEAITLLTKPVEKNERVPFVPYLKRKSLHTNSGVPCKVQKLESASTEKIQCGKSDDSCERKASGDVKTETSCTGSDEAFQPEKTHSSVKLQNLRSDAIKFLEQGMYRSALRKLWITSKKFRSSLLSFIAALLKKETKNLLAHDTLFTKELENTVLDEISWDPTFTILSSVAPTTLQVLYALLGVDLNTVSEDVKESKQNCIGAILSMALYKRYRGKASFLPLLHALYLHNTGTPLKVNRTLHEIGLTSPPCKLYEVLEQLSTSSRHSDAHHHWKTNLSSALEIVHRKPDKKLYSDRRKKLTIIPKASPVASYSLCWDAIQYPTHSSKSKKRKPPLPLMAQAYAVKSRVPYLMTFKDADVRLAGNISFEEYVPDSEDFIRVREQMKTEIKKILVKHISIFNDVEINEEHPHSDAMGEKSSVVDLGSSFKFPSDSGGVAAVLKNLKQYMATDDGESVPVCVFGSASAVEKMTGAKDVMSCFSEKVDRLDGLEPVITDFGRQILIAQDIIKIFYPNGMPQENGNLHDLWAKYKPDLRGESPDFKAIAQFLEIIAHGHTVALAKKKKVPTATLR